MWVMGADQDVDGGRDVGDVGNAGKEQRPAKLGFLSLLLTGVMVGDGRDVGDTRKGAPAA